MGWAGQCSEDDPSIDSCVHEDSSLARTFTLTSLLGTLTTSRSVGFGIFQPLSGFAGEKSQREMMAAVKARISASA